MRRGGPGGDTRNRGTALASDGPVPSRRRSVTLLEIVLAVSLLISLTSMTYWFYGSSLKTRESGTAEAHKLRLARVVLDRIRTEIRQVTPSTADFGVGLRGDKEQIRITYRRVPRQGVSRYLSYRAEPPAEYDLVAAEYRIARHPDVLHDEGWELPLGLARIERPVPRPQKPVVAEEEGEDEEPDSGSPEAGLEDEMLGSSFFDQLRADGEEEESEAGAPGLEPKINWEELYAPEIRYLRFCYYDGHGWWDTWDIQGENPLPQLVMVTIGYQGRPPCGEDFGEDELNEEFCECLNRDPPDCEPLGAEQYSTVVRLPPADPLFRSRVTRETQALVQEASAEEEGEAQGRDQ